MTVGHAIVMFAVAMVVLIIIGSSESKSIQAKKSDCESHGGVVLKDMNANYFCVINGRLTIIEIKE
ncbi:hypothetical protein C121_32 [Stenotrophomonas phage C121]|uniref:hypothetical protein n=1 Tax=Stenotrophomonas phage C121 TaxID=2914029 RepID=UPI0023293BD5|nr:hypothetical protein PP752_gp32 [Stenotrophomonas phage C121]UKL14765.1 hypothetical protein C121_32 [Stenotrophomonas phage C121]